MPDAPSYSLLMFGPLNGVRTALVALAALTAVAAAFLGYWIVTLVLGLAVAIHGLGWWYLYGEAQKSPDRTGSN